jgi:hypothetical protein
VKPKGLLVGKCKITAFEFSSGVQYLLFRYSVVCFGLMSYIQEWVKKDLSPRFQVVLNNLPASSFEVSILSKML